jgi:RNA polymerase sigma factor (sigma-70 family)
MATAQLNGVIRQLRRVAFVRDGADISDRQLLEEFVARREEVAFEALVRRYGPMVLGVCRRVLHNHHDAEDAFQATFLVLVRKAASVVPREKVANWLYGVACQTALKARATFARRRANEGRLMATPEPATVEKDCWRDLQPLLGELKKALRKDESAKGGK